MKRLVALLAFGVLSVTVGCAQAQEAAQEITQDDGGGWTLNWDAVARCESGANWGHGPVRNSAGTFSGGLMIGHAYWKGYGGDSAPYLAPKHVQIEWAENLIGGSYGRADDAWQCVGGPARSGV